MKGSKPPPAPDPTATAAAQTQSNKETAGYTQSMNLIDQNTPLGSLTYTNTGTDPLTGAPKYSSNVSLTPTGQESFDLQQQVANSLNKLALGGTSQVQNAMGSSLNYNNLPSIKPLDLSKLSPNGSVDVSKLGAVPTANDATRQAAADALYKQATSRLDPQFDLNQKRLETQLTNKGVAQGSDAWNTALESFGRTKTDAYDTAQRGATTGAVDYETGQYNLEKGAYDQGLNSMMTQAQWDQALRGQGLAEQQAQQNSDTSARQQGITEADYLRELPINEISSLLNGGQVTMPTFGNTPQTQVQPTNVAGIIQNSYQDQFQGWQQQQQSQNAMIGAVFGAAGSALGGWALGGWK